MNKQHGQNQKQDIINRYFSGEGVTTLSEETGVSRSTIYNWLKVERQLREKKAAEKETYNFKSYSQLKEHVERLEGMLAILKTCGCAPHDPLPVKLKVSERLYHEDNYSVRMICEALDVPRGTFYNHVLRNKRGESSYEKRKEELRIRIREVYEESNQIFGAPKIAAVLQSEGIKTTKEYVRQLMREMGIESIRKRAKKQYKEDQFLIALDCPEQIDKVAVIVVEDFSFCFWLSEEDLSAAHTGFDVNAVLRHHCQDRVDDATLISCVGQRACRCRQ